VKVYCNASDIFRERDGESNTALLQAKSSASAVEVTVLLLNRAKSLEWPIIYLR